MGEGPMCREKLKGQVSCRECIELLEAGYLTSNMITQDGRVAETRGKWKTLDAGVGTRTFRTTFPAKGGPRRCSVEGCPGRVEKRTAMQVQFLHHHVLDTVVILEEGNLPQPRCAMTL